jgi:hypothetical protein
VRASVRDVDMLDSATRTRFEEALASGRLEELGSKLKTEGLS